MPPYEGFPLLHAFRHSIDVKYFLCTAAFAYTSYGAKVIYTDNIIFYNSKYWQCPYEVGQKDYKLVCVI